MQPGRTTICWMTWRISWIEDLEYGQGETWTYDYLLDDMEDELDDF